jgi:hypothetical protein
MKLHEKEQERCPLRRHKNLTCYKQEMFVIPTRTFIRVAMAAVTVNMIVEVRYHGVVEEFQIN